MQTIKEATRRSYGWSYALGWVGMILGAFTATFFSLAGCYITSKRYEVRCYAPSCQIDCVCVCARARMYVRVCVILFV